MHNLPLSLQGTLQLCKVLPWYRIQILEQPIPCTLMSGVTDYVIFLTHYVT